MTEANSINIDLNELSEIMAMLPDTSGQGEQRKNALTRADVMVIAKIVQATSHKVCAMSFTPEEVGKVKTVLSICNKGILGVGWTIMTTIVVAALTAAGWAIKHGIMDIADSAKKGIGK